jgi:hypothetical protein
MFLVGAGRGQAQRAAPKENQKRREFDHHLGLVAILELHDEVVRVGHLAGLHHLLMREVAHCAKAHVGLDRLIEELLCGHSAATQRARNAPQRAALSTHTLALTQYWTEQSGQGMRHRDPPYQPTLTHWMEQSGQGRAPGASSNHRQSHIGRSKAGKECSTESTR